MKKSTKLGLGIAALLFGATALTSCTNSFCSNLDKAHMLYAFDYGVCEYFDTEAEAKEAAGETGKYAKLDDYNVYYVADFSNDTYLKSIIDAALSKQNIVSPSLDYYIELDTIVLKNAIAASGETNITAATINDSEEEKGILTKYGYLKFYGEDEKGKGVLWTNYIAWNNEIRLSNKVSIDECPTNDFITYYKTQMNTAISSYRSCIATEGGYYGHYNGKEVEIEKKDWGYAWKTGFLSGLLVYPIGWLIDTFTSGMLKGGVASGWAQLLSILFVTLIVRSLMLAVTFKQTTASSKMQALQPEIAKIQAKYPNANTNQYEKQRMAEEMQKLYKKNKINPLSSILVMIVQFPVFICVWSAMQGSSYLSSGSFLGLNLSTSISSVLTTWSNWAHPSSGVWTALVLFLLMSAAQTVAMLLPQWMQKAEKKKIAKLGRNPSQKENDKKTKIFTYVMLIMIIFMGFSLVSSLGVYWLVGAFFSIGQTLVTQLVMKKKKSKRN